MATAPRVDSPLSLRVKIVGAFLVSFAFFLAALSYDVVQLRALGEGLTLMESGYVPLARVATRLDASLPRIDLDIERLNRDEPRRIAGHRSNLALYSSLIASATEDGRATIHRALDQLAANDDRAHLITLDLQLATIAELGGSYDAVSGRVLDLVEKGDNDGARALQPELARAQQSLRTEIEQFSSRVDHRIRRASEDTAATQRQALLVAGSLAAAALGFGAAMLALAVRTLRPIGRLTEQVQRIARGTFGERVAVPGRDELGVLAEEVNAMARAIEERDEDLRARAAELDRARAELRSVLDSIRLGLVVVHNGDVALANPAAAALWGVREGSPLPDFLVFGEERADALSITDRLFDLRRVPFGDGFILVGEDVTNAVESRDRLARAERLALVGQMLAQITHEVRNPLNAMSLNTELLSEELDALPEERRDEAQAILGTVTDEIRRLEEVTEHYLGLARRPMPTLQPEEPLELVQGVVRLLEEELRRQGIRISGPVAPVGEVVLDGNQLRRALLNVVRNAAEAGARQIRVELSRAEGWLCFSVIDDGVGMSAEDAERAFDPFFSTKATGSGLGLAITRQILEDHGGRIGLEPRERGTCIVMQIPDKMSHA